MLVYTYSFASWQVQVSILNELCLSDTTRSFLLFRLLLLSTMLRRPSCSQRQPTGGSTCIRILILILSLFHFSQIHHPSSLMQLLLGGTAVLEDSSCGCTLLFPMPSIHKPFVRAWIDSFFMTLFQDYETNLLLGGWFSHSL
jgi:hypothetical protein